MKVLVTGGAGYIGSVVTQRLAARGHEVVVVDDLSTGYRDNVPSDVEFHQLSIHKVDRVLTPGAGFDGVLHLAAKAQVAESVARPDLYWNTNVAGSLALLSAVRAAGTPRLIVSSTCSIYADAGPAPLTEDNVVQPASPYAASKLMVDMLLAAEAKAFGLAAVSLRYANAAGAVGGLGERHLPESHLIPMLLQVAGGQRRRLIIHGTDYPTRDGTCVRDYIHVDDLASAHLLALQAAEPRRHAIYNLGSGDGYSNAEIIEAVRVVTGRTVPVSDGQRRDGDAVATIVSNERARRELGWMPSHTELYGIVRDAWQFYLARLGTKGYHRGGLE
ncbi:UDP-glucose 4-epimerase GalE [Micromonospora sp. CPCC 205561]|uniref:UDP-glucose 4-epimerase GalE n=1 Tax=Micromonospora sp. CPCC 205561 TaxID=3122407 RepID=UPI002FF08EAE